MILRLQYKDIPTTLKLLPKEGVTIYDCEVLQSLKIDESSTHKTKTHWEISIEYSENVERGIFYSVKFSNPIYNDKPGYNKNEWIYARIFSIFKYLEVSIDNFGAVFSVLNKEKVFNEWEKAKKHIQSIYKDKKVDNLIKKVEKETLQNIDTVIRRDPLFSFLFNDLYQDYGTSKKITTQKELTGHFGSVGYPVSEIKSLKPANDNDRLALVDIKTELDLTNWPTKDINEYLGSLLGDKPASNYEYNRNGHYLLNFNESKIVEARLTIQGQVSGMYSKTTKYKLKQKP